MKKYIYTILLVWLAMVNVQAQENNEIQEPKPDEKVVVGAIGGTVDLTALGGASYTIPVKVPEGIGGIQPNLSIVYNSQSGNGLLGWGWNLGGLSAITRVGHTLYHDGYVDGVDFDGDRFSLDGQRLFALDAATYGGDGTEYRTETDGMNKIVSYTETINVGGGGLFGHGPYSYKIISHFKVYTADGMILYYGKVDGEPDNARIIYESDGKKKVAMWLLKRVEDRMGNYMVYNYIIDNVCHNYRLDNIQYCANTHVSDVGLMDRGTKYGVDFHYHKRFDVEIGFIGDHVLYQPWLLDSISVYHWSQPLYSYKFDYGADCGQADSKFFYNRLEHVGFRDTDGNAFYSTNINYGQIPLVNYHNTPAQGDINFEDYCTRIHLNGSPNGVSIIGNQLKFPGDFNGDGLDDFIAVDINRSNSSDSIEADTIYRNISFYIAVYQNKGNTLNDSENGHINFDWIYAVGMTGDELLPGGPNYPNLNYAITGLKWIYVCDFNGDGLDDFVLFREMDRYVYLHAFKSRIDDNGNLTFDKVRFYATNTTTFQYDNRTNKRKASFVTGDFMGRSKQDMILLPALQWNNNPKNFYYFTFVDNANGGYIVDEEAGCGMQGNRFVAADFNGDGKTEIWYTRDDDVTQDGQIVYIYKNSYSNEQYLFATLTGNFLTNKHTLFPGDFNGDGKTDLLTYEKQQTRAWKCLLFKGTQCHFAEVDISEHVISGDPGDYSNSIENRVNGMNTFVQIADFNGDGKSDIVMVRFGNNRSIMRIGFSPHYYDDENGWQFCWKDEINPISAGIYNQQPAFGHHSICVGNFLGRENASMFDCFRLYSKCPISTYYAVQSITDGMGNQVSFDYDYLVHNPMKSNNIYDVNHIGQNLGYDLYNIPLPMKAVKALNSYNTNVPTQAHAVDTFSYANAIVHRKGKGLLGFGRITKDSWLVDYPTKNSQWTKHQSKQVQTYNYKPMEEHRALLLETEELFRYKDDGEEVQTASTVYCYGKGLCERDVNNLGIKVFTPLTKVAITDEYELLGERGHLRRSIVENDYNDQQLGGLLYYRDVFRVTESRQGTDPGTPTEVSNCEFQTKTHTEYAPLLNSGGLWVPNRPHSVLVESSRITPGYAGTKSLTVFSYDNDKPYLPKFVNTYPSGVENEDDPLAMTAYYTYYPTGRLKDESHYPVAGRSEDGFKTMYAYSPDYRFLTTKTEEYDLTHTKDYITLYQYDNVYGNLRVETDCNGYSTYTENPDHLGLTVRSYKRDNDANQSRIPGTETVTALRWIEGSAFDGHAIGLPAPCYFTWERSSGSAETLVIYDALGRRLRTVSHGLPENGSDRIVYQDTRYDQWGRLAGVSEPYFSELPLNQRKWTTYEYGDFDRIDTVMPPTYMVGNQTIEPYTRYEYDGLTTTTTTGVRGNDDAHVTTTTINVMGWTESNVEVIDGNGTENVTTYGHNADGSLAWAMVNGNESTKVKMHYDDAGNRRELYDPNYGKVTNHYNAFGQLVYTVTPKGDTTAYEYDNIGRVWHRTETCVSNQNEPERLTVWNYSETPGRKGLLEGIVLEEDGNETQSIAYAYDMQRYNRMTSKTETLFGTPYTTGYAYSDQDGFPLRLKTTTYPTGFSADREYDATTGQMVQLSHNGTLLWKTEGENAFGQVTQFRYGNGITSRYEYDDRHLLASQIAEKDNETIQSFGYAYDIFANLAARTDNTRNMEERFTYDRLNRLDSIWLNDVPMGRMAYDALGRMTDKRADGYDVFSLAQHDYVGSDGQLRPHAVSSATMGNSFPQASIQSIGYTMFDKVRAMNCNGSNRYVFEYGYDHQRTRMTATDGGMLMVRKDYVDNCEFVRHTVSPQQSFTYLSGPMGVFAMVNKEGETEEVLYILKDHLGSYTAITDDEGDLVLEQSFDAWGNRRDPSTWSGNAVALNFHDRGFTGHEHLFGMVGGIYREIGLINMNGRMYDPVMSSFLSVDNYVQAPDFSQSFNRYAYCLNNPLRYTDPDGEWVQYVIGGLLGAWNGYSIGKAAGLDGWGLVWSTVGGAAVGAATAGIGNVASSAYGATLGGAAAGAFAGAGNGLIQGLAADSKTLGTDVLNGLWKGCISGAVGGYVGGGCGLYGGKAAFLSGCAANLTGQVCNYVTNENNSINWLNVGLSGLTSFAGYHAMLYQGYCKGGFKGLGVKYGEFSEMMESIQQSMRSGREAKYIAYKDPNLKAYNNISNEDNSVATVVGDYRYAKYDMHTHDKFGCDGFSDYTRTVMAGTPPNMCDWHSAGELYMMTGYSGPKLLATAEGHFWMMNNCTPIPIAIPNGTGFNISFSYSWNPQMVTNYNYSHLFHSYQYNFILKY